MTDGLVKIKLYALIYPNNIYSSCHVNQMQRVMVSVNVYFVGSQYKYQKACYHGQR